MNVNNSNRPIGIGAVAGTMTGVAAGTIVGNIKADRIMGDYKKFSSMTKAEYVNMKRTSAFDKLTNLGMRDSFIKKNIDKVAYKAKRDYPLMMETAKALKKDANKTKGLYILGFGAACFAIGTGLGLLKSLKKDND